MYTVFCILRFLENRTKTKRLFISCEAMLLGEIALGAWTPGYLLASLVYICISHTACRWKSFGTRSYTAFSSFTHVLKQF